MTDSLFEEASYGETMTVLVLMELIFLSHTIIFWDADIGSIRLLTSLSAVMIIFNGFLIVRETKNYLRREKGGEDEVEE